MFSPNDLSKVINTENELPQKLIQIQTLLEQGFDPNKVAVKSYKLGWFGSNQHHNVYPLHEAVELEVVQLLLNYGANPTLPGFSKPGEHEYHYPEGEKEYIRQCGIWENLSPLEAACIHDYKKALLLLSHLPTVFNLEVLLNSIRFLIIFEKPLATYSKRSAKYINHLPSKELLFKRLLSKLDNEACHSLIKEKDIHDCFLKEDFNWAKNFFEEQIAINNEISQLAFVHVILGRGVEKIDSVIYGFPLDLLALILSFACSHGSAALDFITQKPSAQQSDKVAVFKKIYTMLAENDSLLSSHTFLENHKNTSDMHLIRQIQKKTDSSPDTLTMAAWKLTLSHYKKFNSGNNELVNNLLNWIQTNNIEYKLAYFDSWKQSYSASMREKIIDGIDTFNNDGNLDLISKKQPS